MCAGLWSVDGRWRWVMKGSVVVEEGLMSYGNETWPDDSGPVRWRRSDMVGSAHRACCKCICVGVDGD